MNTKTVKQLKTIAKSAGLKGYSKLRKAELIELLTQHQQKNSKPRRVHGWSAQIIGLSRYGLRREILTRSDAIMHPSSCCDVTHRVSHPQEGCVYEIREQASGEQMQSIFCQLRNGTFVQISKAAAQAAAAAMH